METETKKTKTQKTWINHRGENVPADYVSPYDKKKEQVAARLIKNAEKLSKKLIEFKQKSMSEADALIDQMYRDHFMERNPDSKGNITVFNFDKSLKFEIKVQDIIEFDDRIQLAQQSINEFLKEKTEGADQDLSTLVNSAFTTTKGRLDKNRVLGLFQLKIKHPLWDKAMELIKESITTNNTRRYISFYRRIGDNQYKLINLNFSSL